MLTRTSPDRLETGTTKPKRYPVSTYRLQFNRSFTFRDATKLVPYLHDLGISHVYASPYLKTRPDSSHGYAITDHNTINPEIGSEMEYEEFIEELHRYNMEHIIDFVPNHMSIFDNVWLTDVLENGPSSPYATFFDIDWYPIKPELRLKLLLPILEDQYGQVLEQGGIGLAFDQGKFVIAHKQHRFPIDPKTTVMVLIPCLERLQQALGDKDTDYMELQSIATACGNLPDRSRTDEAHVSERQREKEIVKNRLWNLYQRNATVRSALDETVRKYNGTPRRCSSFDRLHELLEAQAYRLSYWRVAWDEINYRRFFDINELIALRVENPQVFDLTHKLLLRLLVEGKVAGVRIDHIDGLFDPAGYLARLQNAYSNVVCQAQGRTGALDGQSNHGKPVEPNTADRRCMIVQPLFIVVEKILGDKEILRAGWPVNGTTGYEFGSLVNGIFVNRKNARLILSTYERFTGVHDDFKDILYQSKKLILTTSLSADINMLAHQLDGVSERSRHFRDFTLNSLKDAIAEVIACFPVYRTYIDAPADIIDKEDSRIIRVSVTEARKRNPALSASLFDFLRDALLLKHRAHMNTVGRNQERHFVMHFQQVTSAAMAKGMEDTAFYIYNPLMSLNEVGGSPKQFGIDVDEFHLNNMERQKVMPHSLLATSTHDSKRSEDVRTRIDVLSETPGEWRAALDRWSRLNRKKKSTISDAPVPDRNEEYMLYQALLGTYPPVQMDDQQRTQYLRRIQEYLRKALREAKVHTSWVSPNIYYEEDVARFISAILDSSNSNPFLVDFERFNKIVSRCGMYNSLSQTVLKLLSPGAPDVYRGCEMWDYSLVDPDNRKEIDFRSRMEFIKDMEQKAASMGGHLPIAERLVDTMEDGNIKLYVIWKALTYRRGHPDFFDEGTYVPLKAEGAKKSHVCAFAWVKDSSEMLVIVPRLPAELTRKTAELPVGPQIWGDTWLAPGGRSGTNRKYRNIFTGELLSVLGRSSGPQLLVADALATFPVCVLHAE
ncbi:MAG: malto-oligosyltrehalose synthase [Chloroflexi bacterium]|nr:malto-oligosyltrehalose synthase [Chloroflexota bacterium]